MVAAVVVAAVVVADDDAYRVNGSEGAEPEWE